MVTPSSIAHTASSLKSKAGKLAALFMPLAAIGSIPAYATAADPFLPAASCVVALEL